MAKKKQGDSGNAGQASGFGDKLKKFEKDWDKSKKLKPDSMSDDVLPNGDYYCRVKNTRTGVTQNGKGDPYGSINLTVVSGEHKGARLSLFKSIKSADDLDYLSVDFQRLGYEIDELKITEVEDLFKDLGESKPYVKVQVKHKDDRNGVDRQNVYVQKVVSEDDLPADADTSDDSGDDSGKEKKAAKSKAKPAAKPAKKAAKKK